jgi:Matrixin
MLEGWNRFPKPSWSEIMRCSHYQFDRSGRKVALCHSLRPRLEGLEDRILLYSTLGDVWTYDSRITYSFMPDGTRIGGTPSVLFQTLNAKYPTATWQQQFEQAAALWEGATNANLALVSDGGEPVGVSGNQQDDPRFGDIRIGAIPLSPGVLAETFLPPPANGGTDAGDILFNSTINWQINSTYDIMTLAAHEFGHALGLGDSSVSTAVMYGNYNGIKHVLTTDDISGIQSVYGARQFDQFNQNGHHNSSFLTATNLNSYITSSGQISVPGLDITTSNQSEWFTANVPPTTTGTMEVTVQSSNLSSLAPKLAVYNSSLTLLGQVSAPNTLGATISVTVTGLQSGQQYYFKVLQAGGPGPIGGYGLLVNFGNQSQPPIQPPNTVVAQQPDKGGGAIGNVLVQGIGVNAESPGLTSVGSLQLWAVSFRASSGAPTGLPPTTNAQTGALLAVANTTAYPVPTVLVPITSADVALGTTPSVFQAVDTILDNWSPNPIKKAWI